MWAPHSASPINVPHLWIVHIRQYRMCKHHRLHIASVSERIIFNRGHLHTEKHFLSKPFVSLKIHFALVLFLLRLTDDRDDRLTHLSHRQEIVQFVGCDLVQWTIRHVMCIGLQDWISPTHKIELDAFTRWDDSLTWHCGRRSRVTTSPQASNWVDPRGIGSPFTSMPLVLVFSTETE